MGMNLDLGRIWVISLLSGWIELAEQVHTRRSVRTALAGLPGHGWAGSWAAAGLNSRMRLDFGPKPNKEKTFLSNIRNPL
jgi:hypothetical protein